MSPAVLGREKDSLLLQNIVFASNIVLPTFVMIFLGHLIVRLKAMSREGMDKIGRLCFTYCLSSRVFVELFTSDASMGECLPLLIFLIAATLATFVVIWAVAAKKIKNKSSIGAFVQASFRSSFTVLGLSMIGNLAGNDGIAYASSVLMMTVILYNTMAVLCMSGIDTPQDRATGSILIRKTKVLIKAIFLNPLIIAVLLALFSRLADVTFPHIIAQTAEYLSDMSIPLSLLTIGSSLDLDRIKGSIGLAFIAAFIKTFGLALVVLPVAVLCGFRGLDLAITAILFTTGNPSAAFVMAKSMGCDSELAATSLVISTIMSIFALTFALYILRSLSLM